MEKTNNLSILNTSKLTNFLSKKKSHNNSCKIYQKITLLFCIKKTYKKIMNESQF